MIRLVDEVRLILGAVIAVQLLTAFAAIGLLGRIAPAVERILRENVYSVEAVEEMLAALATPTPDLHRFDVALERARGNVTEPDEVPLLDRIQEARSAGLDAAARRELVANLVQLSVVNRASMAAADAEAQRIGFAGAWAAAVLGLVGGVGGLMAYRRLKDRLVDSVEEMDGALLAVRHGEGLRRCALHHAPLEMRRVGENINWLLDHLGAGLSPASPTPEADRAALLVLLDAQPDPTVLVARTGQLLAANKAALGLPGEDLLGFREAVRASRAAPGWRVVTLESGAVLGSRG